MRVLSIILVSVFLIACAPDTEIQSVSTDNGVKIEYSEEIGINLRKLWNEFDPIGVHSIKGINGPEDEYDAYHHIVLNHLNMGSSHEVIFEDLKTLITGHIGMTWNARLTEKTNKFIGKTTDWFDTKISEQQK